MNMKHVLAMLLAILLGIVIIMLPGRNEQVDTTQRTDLPWLITTHDDGSSTILDLRLGHSRLADAVDKFGQPEGIALFSKAGEVGQLEVYFGTVSLGPLKAKIVVNLAAEAEEIEAILARAVAKKTASNGDIRFTLSAEDQQQASDRIIEAITYIPGYGGLDADFFRERLGEPDAWKREDDERILWFYPGKGLTLLIDADSKEVFQYVLPSAFSMPDEANRKTTPVTD